MTIAVACSCGQRFAAPDQLAGKTVKCPKCSQPLKIPTSSTAASASSAKAASAAAAKKAASAGDHEVFDEIGLTHRGEGLECPSCREMLPHDSVLCVHCGYNFKLKRRMQTLGTSTPVVVTDAKSPPRPMSEAEKMLVRAEDELEHEPVQQDAGYGSPTSAWLLFLLMFLIAAAVIGGGVAFFNYMEGGAQQKQEETTDQ